MTSQSSPLHPRALRGLAVAAVLLTCGAAQAALVTSRAALGGTDFIDWSQLDVVSAGLPLTATSNLGLSASVSSTPSSPTVLRRTQGAGSWEGNFLFGDAVIITTSLDTNSPLSLSFTTGL